MQFVSDDPSGEPFLGVAHPEDPERRTAIQDWYAPIRYLVDTGTGTELKLVVSQMDWAGNQYAAKADFLKSIKEVVSSFQLHWIAWRRSTAIPISCLTGSEWWDDLSVRTISGTRIQRSLLFIRSNPESGVSARSGEAYKYFIAD